MAFERKQYGVTQHYRDHAIIVRHFGPDYLCEVNGSELSPFYLTPQAASKAGMNHVDHLVKEKEEKAKRAAQ